MPDLTVPTYPLGSPTSPEPSTPIPDIITVPATRARNVPQPLPVQPSPSWVGNVAARDWHNWFIECLTGAATGLYHTNPIVYQDPATSALFVKHVYLHDGNTSEAVYPDMKLKDRWQGERGDNLINQYYTAVPTPRSDPTKPTLWTCIDLAGWLFHITATGRVITNCGQNLPDGVFPASGGVRMVISGNFPDGYFVGPNDLCFDPNIPTIIYVADTGNHRIMKVHETSPGQVTVSLYYQGGLNRPYSLYAEPNGTLIVADRENNRVIAIPQVGGAGGTAGTPVVIASGLNQPMVVRKFSDGNICCVEFGAPRRVLEITRSTGALRTIFNMRTPNGDPGTVWLWMDVDDHGTCGPVDDIFTVMSSTFDTLRRSARDGSFGCTPFVASGAGSELNDEGYVVNGSGLSQGALSNVTDPEGHYPWPVACSDTEAKLLVGGTGSTQARQIRRFAAGDAPASEWTSSRHTVRNLGYRIIQGINYDMTKPSPFLTMGWSGHTFYGAPNKSTEEMDAMGWAEFSAFARAGFNGKTPRSYTDTEIQAIKYYIKVNALRGLRDLTVDPIGFEPAPPPDPPVLVDVVTGLDVVVESIADPEPPAPEPPPTPGFVLGANVRVIAPSVVVRSAAGSTSTSLGTQPSLSEGVILGSATVLDPSPTFKAWHNVNFNTGVDGWVPESSLEVFVPPPPPPPTTGEPGTWLKPTIVPRTVYQPYMAGSQSIIEGQPGSAVTVAPRGSTQDGVVFRSFSGTAAGLGKVWWLGGGHAGHPGNCFDIFDVVSKTWAPTPFPSEVPPPYIDGVPNSIWNGIKSGAIATGGFSPTGRPWVCHMYRHSAVDTIRGRLLTMNGNGLGAYTPDGTYTQLAGNNKTLNEVTLDSNGGTLFDDAGNGALYLFASNTRNGATRGIYKYTFDAAGAVINKVRAYDWTPLTDGWSNGTKITVAVDGPGRTAYVFMEPSSTWDPTTTPKRLFIHNLDTGLQTWDQTFKAGTPAWDALMADDSFGNPGSFRAWGRRTATAQLYFWMDAKPTQPVPGWWIKDEATSTWAFTPITTGIPSSLAPWTLNYIDGLDVFVGMTVRSLYCGVGGASCGGLADVWIYNP